MQPGLACNLDRPATWTGLQPGLACNLDWPAAWTGLQLKLACNLNLDLQGCVRVKQASLHVEAARLHMGQRGVQGKGMARVREGVTHHGGARTAPTASVPTAAIACRGMDVTKRAVATGASSTTSPRSTSMLRLRARLSALPSTVSAAPSAAPRLPCVRLVATVGERAASSCVVPCGRCSTGERPEMTRAVPPVHAHWPAGGGTGWPAAVWGCQQQQGVKLVHAVAPVHGRWLAWWRVGSWMSAAQVAACSDRYAQIQTFWRQRRKTGPLPRFPTKADALKVAAGKMQAALALTACNSCVLMLCTHASQQWACQET